MRVISTKILKLFSFSFIFLFCILFMLSSISPASKDLTRKYINIINIDGAINPGSSDFIVQSIKRSEDEKAVCLIMELDTPGGMVTSTRTIVQSMLNSKVPIVVYVSPSGAHAGSAGTFITLAAHVAVMAPGTNIGAAHPVMLGGQNPPDVPVPADPKDKDKDKKEQPKQDHMSIKIENDLSAFIETIAEQRGRNKEWAIKAVRESASIIDKKALELKVIDMISNNTTELISKLNGRAIKMKDSTVKIITKDVPTQKFAMNLKQKFVDLLSTPDIVYILMAIGTLGIYFELSNPGLILPGIAGGISLVLAFVSFQILPFNLAGLILLLLAMALFIAEMYVPTMGMLGIGGIISFIFGSILLFDTPFSDLRISESLIWGTSLAVATFVFLCIIFIARAYKAKKVTGDHALIGKTANVYEDIEINKQGKIKILGEYWNAISEEVINKGEKVKVIEVQDMVVKVAKI